MGTQWREHRCGLDYGPLTDVMRILGVPRSDWGDVLVSVQAMEAEAVAVMAKRREAQNRK